MLQQQQLLSIAPCELSHSPTYIHIIYSISHTSTDVILYVFKHSETSVTRPRTGLNCHTQHTHGALALESAVMLMAELGLWGQI